MNKIEEFLREFRSLPKAQQVKLADCIKSEVTQVTSSLLTVKEVCAMLRISERTFYNHFNFGPPKCAQGGDVRLIESTRIGRKRFWFKASVEKFLCEQNY